MAMTKDGQFVKCLSMSLQNKDFSYDSELEALSLMSRKLSTKGQEEIIWCFKTTKSAHLRQFPPNLWK